MTEAQQVRVVQVTGGECGFVTREIAGELLIVPVSGRVGDLEAIYSLNPVGSRIWQLLQEPRTVEELADIIRQEYEVGDAQAAADVAEFIDALRGAGLVRRNGTRAEP